MKYKCIVKDCKREARYDSPADLCYRDWLAWGNYKLIVVKPKNRKAYAYRKKNK